MVILAQPSTPAYLNRHLIKEWISDSIVVIWLSLTLGLLETDRTYWPHGLSENYTLPSARKTILPQQVIKAEHR